MEGLKAVFIETKNMWCAALAVLLSLSLSALVKAEQVSEIHVVSEAWENSTNKDGTGLYWDIIRKVYEPAGISVKLETTGYARSVALVKNNKKDAWVGSYIDEEEGVIYPKAYFDADMVAALFVPGNDAQWEGEKSLSGKNVGWIKGYELHEYLDADFNKKEFSNRKNVVSLLTSGRLDYYIDAAAELDNYFGDLIKAKKLKRETIKHLNLYLAFSNTERGRRLSEIFDERFVTLLASGEIKALFNKWGSQYIW